MNAEAKPAPRWPGLPSIEALRALPWPYAGAGPPLVNAYELLQWGALDDAAVLRIVEAVVSVEDADDAMRSIESALLESADEIARRVNAPGGELSEHLTAEGWVIPEMRRDRYGVQVEHVFAVGALVAGARLLMLQKKASTLLRDLMKPEFAFKAPDIREALYSTELVIGCCRLAAEAMFISGRVDMRERVMQQEAEVRSERAAHGGRATRKLSDDELSAFCAEWQAKHGRKRGERKAAAAHFGVSDTAIGCRLKKIRTD